MLLWLSWLFWRREERLGAAGQVSEYWVYVIVSVLALACYAVIGQVSLPTAIQPRLAFPRPLEFLPAFFFLLALIGYLRKGGWKTDPFEHWLVLSLIMGPMVHAMFMSHSSRPYDTMFDAAHLLKVGSYICAMVGLLFSMQRLLSESHVKQDLAFTNTVLATQMEISLDAILVVDEHTKIISYNRRFVDLWGLTQEMVSARVDLPVLSAVAAQVREPETFLARVTYLYAAHTEESREEIALKDGRILDRYSSSMIGENGKYYGRVWFFRDITERRRAEQSIRDEKIFSDKLIASLPDIFFVFDSAGRYVRWNKKLNDVLGLSDAQIAAAPVVSVISESDRPAVARKIQEVFEQGAASIDARLVSKTGARDYILSATRADTTHGEYVVGIGIDNTERKHAEQMLRRSGTQLAEAQQIAQLGGWEMDHATNAISWSAETFRIFEEDASAFSPSYEAFQGAVHPTDLAAVDLIMQRSRREHTPFDVEYRLLMKDGRTKHVHTRAKTIIDGQGRTQRTWGRCRTSPRAYCPSNRQGSSAF